MSLTSAVPARLGCGYVEKLASRLLSQGHSQLTLDVSDLRSSHPFADARLLGLVAAIRRKQIALTLHHVGAGTTSHRFESLFLNSLTGVVLIKYAAALRGRDARNHWGPASESQIERLWACEGMLGGEDEVSTPILDMFRGPPSNPVLNAEDLDSFGDLFSRILRRRLSLPGHSETRALDFARNFAYEALQNAFDHGRRDENGKFLNGIRFLSVRKTDLRSDRIDDLVEGGDDVTKEYLVGLAKKHESDLKRHPRLVEITVADTGVGIPARMSGSLEVYERDFREELAVFKRALEPEATSKSSTEDGAGVGLFKMRQAGLALGGLLVYRTGRLAVYQSFIERDAGLFGQWHQSQLGYLGGTSVSLLFPWIPRLEPQQVGLGLDDPS